MTWGAVAGAVIGGGIALHGAHESRNASRDAARAQRDAMDMMRTELSPFQIRGFGGMGAMFLPSGPGNLQPGQRAAINAAGGLNTIAGGAGGLSPTAARTIGRAFPGGAPASTAASSAAGVPAVGSLPGVESIGLSAGDLEGLRAALSQFASQGVPSASSGLPQGVQAALGRLQSAGRAPVDLGLAGLGDLESAIGSSFTDASEALGQAGGGFQRGLQNTSFRGAGRNLATAGQTFDQVFDSTLSNLREQAGVQTDRAFSNLQDNLFATGRMGSSGGALQTEAFARGLAQADASFQLQAQQQAQMAQQNALGMAQGLTGIGSGLRGQEEDLLQSAFGRFTSLTGLAADLSRERFSRSMFGNELGFSRAKDALGTQVQMAGLPSSLQASQLQNVLSAMQGQAGIQNQVLQLFGAGLSAEQAAANARIGAGSNMAQLVGSPSFGVPQQANAAMWAQLGSSLMGDNNLGSALGSLFGSPGADITSPDAWSALRFAMNNGEIG